MHLSIVTAVYNNSQGLQKTMQSLAKLGSFDWEWIVVDSSPQIHDGLLKSFGGPLIRAFSEPYGIYHAQNIGISRATGDVIWFLNGGDCLTSREALATALSEFERDPNLSLVCARANLTRNGRFLYRTPNRSWLASGILGSNRICHQAVFYKSTAFQSVGLFSEQYQLAADYHHLLRCFAEGLKTRFIDETVVEYDMSGKSSNYHIAFEEFKKAQRDTGPRLPTWVVASNEILRPIEYTRVKTIKYLADSPLQRYLRPLWLSWNRR